MSRFVSESCAAVRFAAIVFAFASTRFASPGVYTGGRFWSIVPVGSVVGAAPVAERAAAGGGAPPGAGAAAAGAFGAPPAGVVAVLPVKSLPPWPTSIVLPGSCGLTAYILPVRGSVRILTPGGTALPVVVAGGDPAPAAGGA